jgi:hypothetical protein
MVHALQEAWRVLKADSTLIDLRPAHEHARVGLVREDRFTVRWVTEESLAPYRAASQALTTAKALKLFGPRSSSRFSCTTVFHSAADLKDWLHDWYEAGSAASADRLVRRVEEANKQPQSAGAMVAVVPFMLKVLTKRSLSPP